MWVAILIVIGYAAVLATGSVEDFPDSLHTEAYMPHLSDKPVGEDGYYMLTVAWHTAQGDLLEYNYNQKTTGIQPLGTILYSSIAWIVQRFGGDRWTFVRAVILLGALVHVTFSLLIGATARAVSREEQRANLAFLVGTALSLLNFDLFRTFTYGLETGFYLAGLAACVLWTLRQEKITLSRALVFGGILGIIGLTRIDFGIIVALLLFGFLLQRLISLTGACVTGAIALSIVAPWFMWVHQVTGEWLPSSGTAQGSLMDVSNFGPRLTQVLKVIINHATPWMYTGGWVSLTIVAGGTLLAAGGALWTLRRPDQAPTFRVDKLSVMRAWTGAVASLIFVYPVFFWATHFYARYTTPILVVLLPVLAVGLTGWVSQKYLSWIRQLVVPVLALCFFVWAVASLHTGRIGNSHAVTAGYVKERVPNTYKVGAFQSGVIGFFNSNVVNLDGKIDHQALPHLKTGTMRKHVEQEQVDVIVDWKSALSKFSNKYMDKKWSPCIESIPNGMSFCRVRKSLYPLAKTNVKITPQSK